MKQQSATYLFSGTRCRAMGSASERTQGLSRVGWYFKKDAQGQHEVAAKHTVVVLIWPSHKQKTETRGKASKKRDEGMGAIQKTLKSIYCGLIPESTTGGC